MLICYSVLISILLAGVLAHDITLYIKAKKIIKELKANKNR